jgi:nucleotide-binding universal stress UspA family protein
MDGSVRSLHVLPTVRRLARALEADVLLTTLVTHPVRTAPFCREEDFTLANTLSDRLTRRAEMYLSRIKSQLEASGVVATTTVKRTTDQRTALVDLVRAEDATLTVMSAHGSGCNPQRRFGTMASHFMEECQCPLLMLQDLPRVHKRVVAWHDQRLPARSIDAVAGGD